MPVTTITILIVLAAVLSGAVIRRRPGRSNWFAFCGWIVAGFLSAIATISFAVGLLVLPFALLAILGAAWLSVWPAALGFIAGVGLSGVLVSALNFGEDSSPNYYSWLIAGSAIAAASVAAFAATRPRERA